MRFLGFLKIDASLRYKLKFDINVVEVARAYLKR